MPKTKTIEEYQQSLKELQERLKSISDANEIKRLKKQIKYREDKIKEIGNSLAGPKVEDFKPSPQAKANSPQAQAKANSPQAKANSPQAKANSPQAKANSPQKQETEGYDMIFHNTKITIIPSYIVEYIYSKTTSKKEDNGKVNEIREQIIKSVFQTDFPFFNHSEYGKKWTKFRDDICVSAKNCFGIEFDTIKATAVGARGSHDFKFDFFQGETKIFSKKIEFKYIEATNISELPQVKDLYVNSVNYKLIEKSYITFYYEHYVDKILDYDNEDIKELIKPSLKDYTKFINNSKEKHIFFQTLYDLVDDKNIKFDNTFKQKLATIGRRSVEEFLELYSQSINLEVFKERLEEVRKTFFIFNKKTSSLIFQNIPDNCFKNLKHLETEREKIIISCDNPEYNWNIYLRWKNRTGLQTPAYCISLKKKRTRKNDI